MTIAADEVRFGFGENWRDFVTRVDEKRIVEAEKSLRSLLQLDTLADKSFLDIGSGSGLFSLAARRLGARVHSFDFDAASVASTDALKERYFSGDARWAVEQGSVLDPEFVRKLGTFDIVYSWGVLHHTGNLAAAIESAASCVRPGGLFAFALYRKTALCWAWTIEKRWYADASSNAQQRARAIYMGAMRLAFLLRGRSFEDHLAAYSSRRGMSFEHDVHDWLGGYPYESIGAAGVEKQLAALGFQRLSTNARGFSFGLFGSGCDEYLYRRLTSKEP